MSRIPKINPQTPGLYQVITTANTDYPVAVPVGARGLRCWFETSAASATLVNGRIAFDSSSAASVALTGITNADAVLGYAPAAIVTYEFDSAVGSGAYVHLSGPTALSVARGQWLF